MPARPGSGPTTDRDLRQRAFYYTRIYADPKNKDTVYVTNVQFFRSDDGGKTFPTKLRPPHGDNHDLWIAPNDNQRMIEANDGGATVSVNGGKTWTDANIRPRRSIASRSPTTIPYLVCGAQQDNTRSACRARTGSRRIRSAQYGFSVGGGESGYIANDPLNPDIFYAGSYGGELDRFDYSNGQSRAINVVPDNPMGYSRDRHRRAVPVDLSDRLRPAGQERAVRRLAARLAHDQRRRSRGSRISPDLTRADPATLARRAGRSRSTRPASKPTARCSR